VAVRHRVACQPSWPRIASRSTRIDSSDILRHLARERCSAVVAAGEKFVDGQLVAGVNRKAVA
jgi:hypothetical protein